LKPKTLSKKVASFFRSLTVIAICRSFAVISHLPWKFAGFDRSRISAPATSARLHRMGAHRLFVDVGAPAGPRRDHELAFLDDRRMGDEIVLPRHVVDLIFHDPAIGDGGA